MKLIEFAEQTGVIAKDQPQYEPMPAFQYRDEMGRIAICWKLTWRERWKLLFRGVLWQEIATFWSAVQPQLLLVDKPEMKLPGWVDASGEGLEMAHWLPQGDLGPRYTVASEGIVWGAYLTTGIVNPEVIPISEVVGDKATAMTKCKEHWGKMQRAI